jgi:peroxiredoxin
VKLASLALLVTVSCTSSALPSRSLTDPAAAKLVGEKPAEWQATLWLNSPPLRLADLHGKVVLVRWWTAGCPFCSASAPALREFDQEYRERGLVVVGMYHHKESTPFDPALYQATAKQYGFTFPLAFDPDWKTLESWRAGVDTGFTSLSFLIGKDGVVRYVHPGGQYVKGDPGYASLRAAIERALAEG